ncbi:MAG: fibronectin type III domain-containing protein [Sphingobacteriales bacterium]|nr:MAG: fibronectin type III domain-containing protein [Sphingobacteriales bacterium]
MIKFKVKKDFSDKTDLELIFRTDEVISGLTGNPDYPTPDPTVAALTGFRNDFNNAMVAAANGGTTLTTVKYQKRTVLITALQREANYVEFNGLNSDLIMLSSGFEVYSSVKSPAPASVSPFIEKVTDAALSGSLILQTNSVKYAVVYELRYTEDEYGPTARWNYLVVQTKTKFVVSGLTPGKNYWFQARTISTKGPSEWSDPFIFMPR